MFKLTPILFSLILLGCGNIQNIRTTDPAAEKTESGKLTFMTFNIRAAGGMQNPISNPDLVEETKGSLTKIAAEINSVDPDFIGLQEVRGIHQAKFIAEQLNLNYVYAVHARENWWGQAVLSRYKIIDVRTKIINLGGKYGDRIALMATMDIHGKKLRVINVDFVPENYKGQVNETIPLLNPIEGPVVLLGDFSRRPEYAKMVNIREKMMATCEAAKTAEGRCAGTGYGQVDYIFVDPNNFKVLAAGPISVERGDASGHKAYWATIKPKD
jgi:endonuclease/exonuclease/phosphatase family metal-dependent hydrolase